MGRNKKTEAQRRSEQFGERYRMGKAKLALKEPQMAEIIGVSPSSLRKYRSQPGLFSVDQLVKIGKIMCWTDEDYLAIIRPNK